MKEKQPTNIPASIQARLRNKAKALNLPFELVLVRYGIERFLYRLNRSKSKERFILKGGQLQLVWNTTLQRPTRDIDFLAYVPNTNLQAVDEEIAQICHTAVEDDGLIFRTNEIISTKSLKTQRIQVFESS